MFGTEVQAGTAPPAQQPPAPQQPLPPTTERSAAAPTAGLPPRLPGCLRADASAALCLECERGLLLASGACLHGCPERTYADQEHATCRPCHYTCAACQGPNDYQCRECHGDATLTPGPLGALSCLNTELLERARAADRWYNGVLVTIIVLLVALLVLGALLWRQRRAHARGYRALPVGYLAAAGGYTDTEPANGKPGGALRPDVTVVRPLAGPLAAGETSIDLPTDGSDSSDEASSLLGSSAS